MDLDFLFRLRNDLEECILFLRRENLILNTMACPECLTICSLVKYKRHKDGQAFRCNNRQCVLFKKYFNIRKNSIFEQFSVPLNEIIIIMYYFFFQKKQFELTVDFQFSEMTIKKVYKMCREKINYFLNLNPIRLGGNNIICQVDESMFHYKQKYHTGRTSQANRWVFGIIEVGSVSPKYFVKVVENRNATTLCGIIRELCYPGTIIWSDQFRAYNSLNQNYSHETVNHRLNYVNPESGVHTQNIESLWNKLKYVLKNRRGIGNGDLQSFLNENMFLEVIAKKNVTRFLDLFKLQ